MARMQHSKIIDIIKNWLVLRAKNLIGDKNEVRNKVY
jgi:hypothetical protein